MEKGTRCTARRKNGKPCTNWAIRGASVCRMHGGGAPQVKRAAQVRLLMASDTLMAELLLIALDKRQPTPVRLAAIRDALDRAGLSGKTEVEVDLKVSKWDETVEAVVIEEKIIDADVVEGEGSLPTYDTYATDDDLTEALDNARRRNVQRGKSPALTDAQRRGIEQSVVQPRRSLATPALPPAPERSVPEHPGPPMAENVPKPGLKSIERHILARETPPPRNRNRKHRR